MACCTSTQEEGINTLTIQRNLEAQNLSAPENSFSDSLDDFRETFKLTLAFTQGGLPAIAAEVGQNIIIDQTTDALVDVVMGRDEAQQQDPAEEIAQAEAIQASIVSIRSANSGSMPVVGEDPFQARDNAIARGVQAELDVAASMGAGAPVTVSNGDASDSSPATQANELATAA